LSIPSDLGCPLENHQGQIYCQTKPLTCHQGSSRAVFLGPSLSGLFLMVLYFFFLFNFRIKLLLNTIIKMISKELFDYEIYFLCVLKNITEAKNMSFILIFFEKNI
jgi:hypothetical protein